MPDKDDLKKLKEDVQKSMSSDEPVKKEKVVDFKSRFQIYKDDFDKLIAAEALDLGMWIYELEHRDSKEKNSEDTK